MNILMGLFLFPLQSVNLSDIQIQSGKMNSTAQIFAIGVGIVVILLVILNVYKSKFQSKAGGKHSLASEPRQFSTFTLHRITSELGLDREQINMLDYVMKSGGVTDPGRFLSSPGAIDKCFRHAHRIIEHASANDEEMNERLSVLFSTRNIIDANAKGGNAASSESGVMGAVDAPQGPGLQPARSGKPKELSSRRETIISTAFYLVRFDPATKKMTMDKRKCAGSIQDISADGCSIKTSLPLNAGQRLKIEFTRDDNSTDSALGEVLRLNRSGASSVLHIKFLKVPRKPLNAINAMVCDYGEK
ncbi:MAG: PilZ domain-containing protein [Treponema sp.]|jgi:hypothetical protein|nr:PilZ domain-containing protein [Treponema sp.]